MSPEVSENEQVQRDSDQEDSDEENPVKKSIVVSPLGWRSPRFNEVLHSLDRKWLRRATERSRTMMKSRREGPEINAEPPEGIPAWMKRDTRETAPLHNATH